MMMVNLSLRIFLSMKDLQIRKWQQIAFTMGLVTVMSVAGVIYVSTRATFIPYNG